jgi:hypothetical protein
MSSFSPKVFFLSYKPGFSGDFFTQWLSNNDNYYQIEGIQKPDTNRYLIAHPLSGYGFDTIKGAYRPEHIAREVGKMADTIDANFSEKHLIVNSHYTGPLDVVKLPRLVPTKLVCSVEYQPLMHILAFLKLHLHQNDNGLGLLALARRLRADNQYTGTIADVNNPVELVRDMWDRMYVNEVEQPGYYHLNVSDLFKDPAKHVEEWYDLFEINPVVGQKEADIALIKEKAFNDVFLIEQEFGIKIERLLDPSLQRDWLTRLEDIVKERLNVYHKNV